MNRKRYLLLILSILLIGISIWQIIAAQAGLTVVELHTSNPPVTIITPAGATPASRPTVLIAHGFAGSSVLMRGFALTLAHAGYSTVSWDFRGHGTNPNPFVQTSGSNLLLQDAVSALTEAGPTGLINYNHIAILGHSMGSGVALSYGTFYPDTSATIAISPVIQPITHLLPHDLLLLAGSLEPQFVNNAEQLLIQAGGESSDTNKATSRKLEIIQGVEHISILFSPHAQAASRAWLDGVFGPQPGESEYIDRRIIWFGLGIVGFILLANSIINMLSRPQQPGQTIRPIWHRLIALFFGGIIATVFLWLTSIIGLKLNSLLGLLVGGYILIWFGVAGVISLIILRTQIKKPTLRELGIGLIAFSGLWLGIGLLGNYVWLPWLLIPDRLWLWIPASIMLFPWFFTVGESAKVSKLAGQIGWWLFQSIIIIFCLFLAITINPELGFVFIILPLVPVMIGSHMLVISAKHGTWSFAMVGAMFTGWLLLAVFPLQ